MNGLLIFDMDGTIADTSGGIYSSYLHIADYLGVDPPSKKTLSAAMGGALPTNLKRVFNLNDNDVPTIVKEYRNYYASEGYKGSILYDGFFQAVHELIQRDYILAIATMKAESFAQKLIEQWNLSGCFSYIRGANTDDSISKTQIIMDCVSKSGISLDKSFMIGDSTQDYEAAKTCGINFLAVTYGFHYSEELCRELNLDYITSPSKLLDKFN